MRNCLFPLLLVTGACQPAPTPDAAQSPMPAPELPQPLSDIRDYEWSIPEHADTSRTALMMGRPNSGDIIVTFWCTPGSGRLQMETYNNGSEAARLLLASGPASETIDVTPVPPDDFYGEGFIRVELDMTDPVLAAFRKSGALSKGEPPYALRTATPEELAIIEKYFALCERK
jgi:hypothetical protein